MAEEHVAEKGLELGRDFVCRGADETAFIGLHALLSLFAQVRQALVVSYFVLVCFIHSCTRPSIHSLIARMTLHHTTLDHA